MGKIITHEQLVISAARWLVSAKQCNPVFCEKGSSKTGEMPDAIGWTSKGSILVECKVSRDDFIADLRKPFRVSPEKGLGKFRFYCVTPEFYIYTLAKIPVGWGVVLVGDDMKAKQARLRSSDVFEFDVEAELYYLRNRILAKDISENSC